MEEQITLTIGQKKRVKLGMLRYLAIVYCGMSSEDVFSVGYMEAAGYQGYSLNLYFPKDASTIKIKNAEFRVISADKEKLVIQPVTN